VKNSALGFVVLLGLGAGCAHGQAYPAKQPIRVIVPLASGGTGDTLARLAADEIRKGLNAQVVVDNRPGANGIIGLEALVKAAPDGYTLVSASTGNVPMNAALYGTKLPFNVERDLAPITQIATTTSVVIVHPSLPAHSIKALIALARKRPGAINYASAGVGSAVHLGTALFELMAHVKMTHVPYKGSTPGRVSVVSGETDLMFDGLLPARPLIQSGKLRALAVTAAQRSAVMPDLPTIAEAGLPKYEASTWYALFAPRGTPAGVIHALHDVIAKALQRRDVRERLLAQGADPSGNTPQALAALVKSETVKWGKVIQAAGVKPE
jgi:tripartite-type tricarboxylate transporter receptor subunit TctC